MSTFFADINAALDSRLSSLAGGSPIAWSNTVYKPIKGTLYLKVDNLPSAVEQAGLGNNGLDEYRGIYQVTVFAPAGQGRGIADAKADAIADHFKRGTVLVYNGLSVRLGNVSRNAGFIDGDRFVVAVSVNYYAHVAPR